MNKEIVPVWTNNLSESFVDFNTKFPIVILNLSSIKDIKFLPESQYFKSLEEYCKNNDIHPLKITEFVISFSVEDGKYRDTIEKDVNKDDLHDLKKNAIHNYFQFMRGESPDITNNIFFVDPFVVTENLELWIDSSIIEILSKLL